MVSHQLFWGKADESHSLEKMVARMNVKSDLKWLKAVTRLQTPLWGDYYAGKTDLAMQLSAAAKWRERGFDCRKQKTMCRQASNNDFENNSQISVFRCVLNINA